MNMSFFSLQSRASTTPTQMVMGLYPRGRPALRTEVPVSTVASEPVINKVRWGEPTWFLFHTLSVKVRDEDFLRVREGLLNCIYSICVNLPCPLCADHAKTYLEGVNFNTIQTKEDLQRLLYTFHNSVNVRKNYPMFPYDELLSKYSLANTNNIIRNFMMHFSEKSHNPKLAAGDFLRSRLVGVLKQWFNDNIQAFYP